MKKLTASILICMLILSSIPSMMVFAATTPQLTVDLSNQYRPVTRVASGSLYGLADEGRPVDSLIAPTKPLMFTQMAPDGGQLPNGETSPTGDALKVAPIAARNNGATVTIRMPDIFPSFPYSNTWVSMDDWLSKVDTMVNKTLASGATNIYGYELWNEPDWTWPSNAGSFLDGWKATYQRVRALDPNTPTIGPSYSRYEHQWYLDFLTYAKNNNVVPDIISWHELGWTTPNTWEIKAHIDDYRAIEASLGISPRPISINEYGVPDEEGVPGGMVRYFAQFERGGVETACSAFWFRPGRLSNIITDDGTTNGGWWLYKWYGDMSGQMAMTTPAVTNALGLDGIASIDSSSQTVHVLYGGGDGDNTVVVKGFASAPFFSGNARVKVETAPWYGVDTAISAPTTIFEGDFAIVNGQISVPVSGMDKSYGYHMIITPTGTTKNRYEAENATISSASILSHANASNGKYVGGMSSTSSYVHFTVNAATAGAYTMEVRYANGNTLSATHNLSVNGGSSTTVTYPVTGGWMSAGYNGTVKATVNLNAGSNTIRLTKGSRTAELDHIQLTKVPDIFSLRVEAEKSTISNASVFPGGYASGAEYVGYINYSTSYVQFAANVPTAGTYYMDIGFANGTSGNSTHNLSINGGSSSIVTYGSTGNWHNNVPNFGARKIKAIPVTLNAGNNTIRLTYGGTGFAELDYIELAKDVARYEAETATRNNANVFSSASTSNGSYVGQIDFSDSYVQFNVNASTAGTYKLKIAYGNGTSGLGSSTHNLSVNGGSATTVTYATTGGWLSARAGGIKTVNVTLNAGSNTIRLSKGSISYAELDYIDVSK